MDWPVFIFIGMLLGVILIDQRQIRAQGRLLRRANMRIGHFEKLACCGCGHLLSRHDDPNSADGFGCRDCNCQAVHNLVDAIERPRR